MNKFVLFLVDLAMGITLAIQVLVHPRFDASAKTMYLIAAIVFINWAVFTWLAYSSVMKQKQVSSTSKSASEQPKNNIDQGGKSLLNITTVAYLSVILLALICLNVLVLLEMTETSYVVWIFLTAILLPLLVTVIANRTLSRAEN